MNDRDKNVLLKLKEEAVVLQELTDGCNLQGFLGSEVLKRAVGMTLINIGELVHRLTDEIKQQTPVIPWRAITRLRNIAAHGYHTLEMEDVWKTVTEDVPLFQVQIGEILQGEENTD